MKTIRSLSKISAELIDHAMLMHDLANRAYRLESRIARIARKIDQDLDLLEGFSAKKDTCREYPRLNDTRQPNCPQEDFRREHPRIIHFPAMGLFAASSAKAEPHHYRTEKHSPERFFAFKPLLAKPGKPLPQDIPDFRPLLQRDGLILLAWDKRITEMGERYTAYWVTSAGTPRFYASKPLSSESFSTGMPDHKSYAAEDGIEFYGQEAPAYLVHVAPELMMSNPRHRELRQAHIETLKQQGSKVDFGFKYLLTAERKPAGKKRAS